MRVVVLSSTSFGYECIKRGVLTTPAVQLAGILTTPSSIKFSKSGSPMSISKHSTFEDLGALAGCEVVELAGDITESIYRPHLDRWRPDLILVLGWYYMLPRKVREKAALGCMGVHASLLPMYRGWAPISWAIINGETETGVTLFHLEDEVDSGDVVAQESFAIDREDTCATVYEKAGRGFHSYTTRTLASNRRGQGPANRPERRRCQLLPQTQARRWPDRLVKNPRTDSQLHTCPDQTLSPERLVTSAARK